jgi:hypothetical protein
MGIMVPFLANSPFWMSMCLAVKYDSYSTVHMLEVSQLSALFRECPQILVHVERNIFM